MARTVAATVKAEAAAVKRAARANAKGIRTPKLPKGRSSLSLSHPALRRFRLHV